jgi:Tol biopolymer transport system component
VAFIWSPTSVAVQASDPSSSIYELQVVDVASGTVTTLARETGAVVLGPVRFSPEGDRILYSTSDTNDAGGALWSVKVDGSNPQLLVTGTTWGDWQVVPAGR